MRQRLAGGQARGRNGIADDPPSPVDANQRGRSSSRFCEIEGRVTSLRKVDFTNGRQNFVLILSPGVIDKAPHAFLATVRVPDRDENAMYRAVTDRFPSVSTVRVKDTIAQVNGFLRQLSQGMGAASLLTVISGLLVLTGAIAAGARARLYDATVLKVVGATRAQIALVYVLEYGLLGITTGIIALGAGTLAAKVIASQVLNTSFVFDAQAALWTVAGGGAATLLFGLFGAIAALKKKCVAGRDRCKLLLQLACLTCKNQRGKCNETGFGFLQGGSIRIGRNLQDWLCSPGIRGPFRHHCTQRFLRTGLSALPYGDRGSIQEAELLF